MSDEDCAPPPQSEDPIEPLEVANEGVTVIVVGMHGNTAVFEALKELSKSYSFTLLPKSVVSAPDQMEHYFQLDWTTFSCQQIESQWVFFAVDGEVKKDFRPVCWFSADGVNKELPGILDELNQKK